MKVVVRFQIPYKNKSPAGESFILSSVPSQIHPLVSERVVLGSASNVLHYESLDGI